MHKSENAPTSENQICSNLYRLLLATRSTVPISFRESVLRSSGCLRVFRCSFLVFAKERNPIHRHIKRSIQTYREFGEDEANFIQLLEKKRVGHASH